MNRCRSVYNTVHYLYYYFKTKITLIRFLNYLSNYFKATGKR